MSAKQTASKLQTFSVKLLEEAIRAEKLGILAGDLAIQAEDISIKYDDQFDLKSQVQQRAASKLREISFSLSEMDAQFQEIAWSVDQIVDLVEELPLRPAVPTCNPPDAWK